MTCTEGSWQVAESCQDACADNVGCAVCQPGETTCDGDVARVCKIDGTGFVEVFCDPLQGMSCDVEGGGCAGECAPQNLGREYIGCDYYPTVTGNEVDSLFSFAVAISNTSSSIASIHIEGGALSGPVSFDVLPNRVVVRRLPWVRELKACTSIGQAECGPVQSGSAHVPAGAYRLRSTRPVTVYQFSPLEYVLSGPSWSNDASLLLPVNALTGNYAVASLQDWTLAPSGRFPSLLAVTATKDGTRVTVRVTAPTEAGPGAPAAMPGTEQHYDLQAGDVLQLFGAEDSDLTGSMVSANEPVQVIGGHYCAKLLPSVAAGSEVSDASSRRTLQSRTSASGPRWRLCRPTGQWKPVRPDRHPRTARRTAPLLSPPGRLASMPFS